MSFQIASCSCNKLVIYYTHLSCATQQIIFLACSSMEALGPYLTTACANIYHVAFKPTNTC